MTMSTTSTVNHDLAGRPAARMHRSCFKSRLVVPMMMVLSIGCDGKPKPVTPAPPMSADEKREFEARISGVIDQERKQRQEQLRLPLPPPEKR